jgi:hypothetical protein
MGGACSRHRELKNAYEFYLKNLKIRDRLGDLYVHGRIILK